MNRREIPSVDAYKVDVLVKERRVDRNAEHRWQYGNELRPLAWRGGSEKSGGVWRAAPGNDDNYVYAIALQNS